MPLWGYPEPRRVKAFEGLSLDDKLTAKDTDAICGLAVIDTVTGNVAHWLEVEGLVSELYDVAVLPGVVRPMALGFKSDEISRFVTIDYPNAAPRFQPLNASAETVPTASIDFLAMQTQHAAAHGPSGAHRARRPPIGCNNRLTWGWLPSNSSTATSPFRPFTNSSAGHQFREPLLAILASNGGETAGLALAEINPESERARLISCQESAMRCQSFDDATLVPPAVGAERLYLNICDPAQHPQCKLTDPPYAPYTSGPAITAAIAGAINEGRVWSTMWAMPRPPPGAVRRPCCAPRICQSSPMANGCPCCLR